MRDYSHFCTMATRVASYLRRGIVAASIAYAPSCACGGEKPLNVPADQQASQRAVFPGRPNRVPLDYMHEVQQGEQKPARPGTPAAALGAGVNKQRNSHFIKFTIESRECYAKVIELRVNRPVARGGKNLTDAVIGSQWRSIFVAFETDRDPRTKGFDVHTVASLESDKVLGGKYAWRGKIEYETGKSAPVLILLAREESRSPDGRPHAP